MMGFKSNKRSYRNLLWILVLIGFAAIEFPGIFFINRIEPYILGMPFIYGFVVLIWGYMSFVLLIAYKTRWGKKKI